MKKTFTPSAWRLAAKRLCALIMALSMSITTFAYDFMIGKFAFNIIPGTTTVEVAKGGDYTGSVIVPRVVKRNNILYTVTAIGDDAFYGCDGLTSVTLHNSLTSIGERAFTLCKSLTSITIPGSVTSIGEGAFSYCDGLTSVTLPNSLTSLGEGAFYGCDGLTSVTLPNSLTSIGKRAFSYCQALKKICSNITKPNVVIYGISIFSSETYSAATVVVPKGTRSAYCSISDPWGQFSKIYEEGTLGDLNNDGLENAADAAVLISLILGNY